jgi:leukotriene-A4 hydrolase
MDRYSYANPDEISTRHLSLDFTVDFEARTLAGTVELRLARPAGAEGGRLRLDTRDLTIASAEATAGDGGAFAATAFDLGGRDPVLGAPLTVTLPAGTDRVRLRYHTAPGASGLQWLEPAQTAGGVSPFVYSQAEAIHARSFVPCQDSPAVRVTFDAVLRVPGGLVGVMAAHNESRPEEAGVFRFRMPLAVPSYLIALAAGDLAFRATGPRTGVWAEPALLAAAAAEFEDGEAMVEATEGLYGPYRWGRFDALVLPPSFPYGGMENPTLTFLTPTLVAGDKSLVGVVAHELAHSWSGNLVTNATWEDFWLNEGFTTYIERRIIEAIYGRERAEMEWLLGRHDLDDALTELAERPGMTKLSLDLEDDPDEGVTQIAYEKGALFLRLLEEAVGRERFDRFLMSWFESHAFTSQTTAGLTAELGGRLFEGDAGLAERLRVEEWLYAPGLPANAPVIRSDAFERTAAAARAWVDGALPTDHLPLPAWSTFETLDFIHQLPTDLPPARLADLDAAFHLTDSGNAEIVAAWLLLAIQTGYHAADARLRQFLITVGRRKYLRPLYSEMVKTDAGQR